MLIDKKIGTDQWSESEVIVVNCLASKNINYAFLQNTEKR